MASGREQGNAGPVSAGDDLLLAGTERARVVVLVEGVSDTGTRLAGLCDLGEAHIAARGLAAAGPGRLLTWSGLADNRYGRRADSG